MDCVIGLDLGTTTIKAMVFSRYGEILGASSFESNLILPKPGYVEQDPALWYETACSVIRQALLNSKLDGRDVRALSISSQGISFMPVDSQYKPLMNAICWLDERAQKQREYIELCVGADAIFVQTGKYLLASYTLPKLLWLREHEPELFKRTDKFLMPLDYAVARLTGRAITDHSMAAGTMLYDVHVADWSDELLRRFEIERDKLPEVWWAGSVIGELLPDAARRCTLPPTVKVILGGQDQKVAAYGASLAFHVSTLSLGTAGALEFMFDAPIAHPQKELPSFPYVEQNQWVLEGCINTAGASIKWLKETLFPALSYDEMNALAQKSEAGAHGLLFYPFLSGPGTPHHQPSLCGTYTGIRLHTEPADLIRALFEGLAFEVRQNIEAAAQVGSRMERLHIFGGGSKSRILCQTIADVTGQRIRAFSSPEFGNIGAGCLAAKGCGWDVQTFRASLMEPFHDFIPQRENQEIYESVYKHYCQLAGF